MPGRGEGRLKFSSLCTEVYGKLPFVQMGKLRSRPGRSLALGCLGRARLEHGFRVQATALCFWPGPCCRGSSLGSQPVLGQPRWKRQGFKVAWAVMGMLAALGSVVTLCATALVPPTPPCWLVCPGHLQRGTEQWSLGPSCLMLPPSALVHS